MKKTRYPGSWDLSVRGGGESDENYRETIIRESLEELDLNLLDFELRESIKVKSKSYFTQWFLVEVNKNIDFFTLNREEVDELKWFNIKIFEKELNKFPEKFTDTTKIHYEAIKKFEKGLF